jgi:hypothetical protein
VSGPENLCAILDQENSSVSSPSLLPEHMPTGFYPG